MFHIHTRMKLSRMRISRRFVVVVVVVVYRIACKCPIHLLLGHWVTYHLVTQLILVCFNLFHFNLPFITPFCNIPLTETNSCVLLDTSLLFRIETYWAKIVMEAFICVSARSFELQIHYVMFIDIVSWLWGNDLIVISCCLGKTFFYI